MSNVQDSGVEIGVAMNSDNILVERQERAWDSSSGCL